MWRMWRYCAIRKAHSREDPVITHLMGNIPHTRATCDMTFILTKLAPSKSSLRSVWPAARDRHVDAELTESDSWQIASEGGGNWCYVLECCRATSEGKSFFFVIKLVISERILNRRAAFSWRQEGTYLGRLLVLHRLKFDKILKHRVAHCQISLRLHLVLAIQIYSTSNCLGIWLLCVMRFQIGLATICHFWSFNTFSAPFWNIEGPF